MFTNRVRTLIIAALLSLLVVQPVAGRTTPDEIIFQGHVLIDRDGATRPADRQELRLETRCNLPSNVPWAAADWTLTDRDGGFQLRTAYRPAAQCGYTITLDASDGAIAVEAQAPEPALVVSPRRIVYQDVEPPPSGLLPDHTFLLAHNRRVYLPAVLYGTVAGPTK